MNDLRELDRLGLGHLEELARAGRLSRTVSGLGEPDYLVLKGARVRGISDEAKRRVQVVITDKTVDSYGDRVHPEGANLARYRMNPVVLIDHDYRVASIVGKSVQVFNDAGQMVSEDEFDPAGTNAAADMTWAKIVNGSLRTVSIGFMPVKWAKILDDKQEWTGGFDFLEWSLLEHSWVPVPANPSAHMGSRPATTASSDALVSARDLALSIDNRLTIAGLNARLEEWPKWN